MTTAYDELLNRARRLSPEERVRLADALLEEELGFGMWQSRADVQDTAGYVERIRKESMRAPNGGLKDPDEFLNEVEAFDE
ncbi:MAG: hypothetical protein AABN34_22480 [Acidobacteriota bacterium]